MHIKNSLFAFILLLSTAAYSQPVKLVLTKGQTFEVTTTLKTNSVSSMMGQDMENNVENTTTETYTVKDTRAGETDLVKKITRMQTNMKAMGQEMTYDSESKNNEGPMAESLDKLVGNANSITIDEGGKIIKEEKKEEEDAVAQLGLSMGTAPSAGISILNPSFINREVTLNSSWTDSTITLMDKIKTSTSGTYTVTALDGDIASISFEGEQLTSGTLEQMGMEMGMSGKSKISIRIKLNLANGLVTETTNTTDGTNDVEVMGMSLPGKVKTTVITKLKML